MKKITIISNQAFSLINFRGKFLEFLYNNNYKIHCLAPDFTEEIKKELIEIGCIPIDYKLNRSSVNPITEFLHFFLLFFKIKKINPDIIFSYSIKPVIYASIISYFVKTPKCFSLIEGLGYIFTYHRSFGLIYYRVLLKFIVIQMYKLSLPFNKKVFFLNTSDINEFQSRRLVSVEQTELIDGIGLDLKYFSYQPATPKDKIVFLYLGRLLREKGLYEFIEAAIKIRKVTSQASFLVVGDIDTNPGSINEREVKQWVKEGLIDWIRFTRDVRPYLQKSSVFVLPSYYREGLPRSIQEAMAIGRPIITCDSVGCRETVEENKNGFLVPIRDSETLAKKMEIFLEQRKLINQMGLESRKIAEKRFDVHKINQIFLKYIKSKS